MFTSYLVSAKAIGHQVSMSFPLQPIEICFNIHWLSMLRTQALFQAKLH